MCCFLAVYQAQTAVSHLHAHAHFTINSISKYTNYTLDTACLNVQQLPKNVFQLAC